MMDMHTITGGGNSGMLGKPAPTGEENCDGNIGNTPQLNDHPEWGVNDLSNTHPLELGGGVDIGPWHGPMECGASLMLLPPYSPTSGQEPRGGSPPWVRLETRST